MKKTFRYLALVAVVCALPVLAEEKSDASEAPANAELMASMMEKAKHVTAPGPHHELLKRFVGTWDIETRFVMGGKKTPPRRARSPRAG